MKVTYLAPKNDMTESIDKSLLHNFSGYIDKNKKDLDTIAINSIDVDNLKNIIIYSPKYSSEIYYDFLRFVTSEKIKFYLFNNIYTSSLFFANSYYKVYLSYLSFRKYIKQIFQKSETAKVRSSLSKYCIGNGIDIGFGGDPIVSSAVTVDLAYPYAKYKNHPLHLKGSGDDLFWFKDNVLDYVYSSHLLEDFEDTETVLNEWLRVLKPNGSLVLFLPNEQLYRQYCQNLGAKPNHNHVHDNFSLNFIKDIIKTRNDLQVIHEVAVSHIYSFELVIKKLK
ncbi:MAG: methyltransferase domain-containing protein [Aliarcobacter butzleri]|jgi:hypothetical protein|nr:methyltransferase domain-containing protein [Aliarcobacter butzleri]